MSVAISHRNALQPATLPSPGSQDGMEGARQAKDKSAAGLEGREGPRSIRPSTPVRIAGMVDGAQLARSLSERTLHAATPQQIGARRDLTAGLVNKLINAIESERAKDGVLSQQGEALRECVNRFADAFELLGEGPVVGDRLLAQMERLEDVAASLESGIDADPGTLLAGPEVDSLRKSLLAQVQDRLSYLGRTVDNAPLSLPHMYESKAQFSEVAVRVLDTQLDRVDLGAVQRDMLEKARKSIFQARAGQLHQEAREHAGKLGDPRKVLGSKPSRFLGMLGMGEQHRAREALGRELLACAAGGALPGCDTPQIDEQTLVQDTLKKLFKEAGLDTSGLKHAFHRGMNDVLNNGQEWGPVRNGMQLRTDGETLLSHSEITPAGDFSRDHENPLKPELGRTASYRGRGINSHDTTEYHHGVNVAQTRLLDGQGQVLFSGMRHGVISAFGINQDAVRHMSDQELAPMVKALLPEHLWTSTNHPVPNLTGALEAVRQDSRLVDTMRANANHNRARDTVLSTLLADSALAQRAFSGGAVALDILSISLLTPDNVRPLVSDASKNERQMMREQMQAWDSVKGEQSFLVADGTGRMRTIKVNVNPVACNYGVNAGAVGSASWLVGGWDNVEGINGKAIGELLGGDIASLATTGMPGGLIGERMQALEEQVRTDHEELQHAVQVGDELQADKARARLRLDEPRLAQARELARQIARIHQDGSYRSAGQEPYKMPTRLAVLAEMFGLKVLFNCKSGKDRTGELDAEIKHFKLQMGLSGKVPDHERTRSAAEIAQFHEVVTQSGNFEMQRLNTGYAGYKLKGVEALYRQFGGERKGDALTANFHGLSHLTAS